MASPSPDREEQANDWQQRAPAWTRWAGTMERMADRFNQPLLDAAGIADGQTVLDLASGAGEPALSIARRVGPSGHVTATDLVPEMLDGIERRAQAANLSNLSVRESDMQALPFEDESFDRVVCRFGIMFSPDEGKALSEALRVLKPGGRAAYMVWGPLEDTTVFVVLQSTVRRFLGDQSPPAALPQFRFGPAGSLASVFEAAGFTDVAEQELRFHPRPEAGSGFWRPQLDMSFGHRIRHLSSEERQALDATIDNAFEMYREDDVYRLTAHIRIVTGDKAKE
tara:strand:+ start:1745 stop:2590 length:846 start_codon:yes stop_codon:yes gene_type:complete